MSAYLFVSKIRCRCDCGAKVRIPEFSERNQYCPTCGERLDPRKHATGEAPFMTRVEVSLEIMENFMKWNVRNLLDQEKHDPSVTQWSSAAKPQGEVRVA